MIACVAVKYVIIVKMVLFFKQLKEHFIQL